MPISLIGMIIIWRDNNLEKRLKRKISSKKEISRTKTFQKHPHTFAFNSKLPERSEVNAETEIQQQNIEIG